MACRLAVITLVLTFCLGDSRRLGLEGPNRAGTLASLDPIGEESEGSCQRAETDPNNQWRFTLDYEHAVGVRHNEEYVLKPEAGCTGEDVANVSVIPKIDSEDPLHKSFVVITMEPKVLHQRVYVCRVFGQKGRCLASLMPPSHSFRPHQLLMGLPVIKSSRRLLDLHLGETNLAVDVLEWIMFIIVLCFLGATGHAIYELAFGMKLTDIVGGANLRGASRRAVGPSSPGDTEAVEPEPCPIDISSPFWEAIDAWVNSSSFVVACVSLLSVLLSILVNADGPPALMVLTILWPVSCGNFLLCCFWMSTCRLQLYSAALTRGICIRGEDPTSPTLILMGGCISVLVLCAFATGLMLLSGQMNDGMATARKISPYVINPITSLSSIFVFLYFRSLAHHKTQRPMAIDAMVQLLNERDKEEGDKKVTLATVPNVNGRCIASQLKAGSVPIISEGTFCELCRLGKDPVTAIQAAIQDEEPLPEGPSFEFADLGWQGRMVYHLSGYSVAILNTPVAVFFFLTLTAASVCLAIVVLTTQPSIKSFDTSENSLGRLNPPLRPWQTDYELVLDQTAHSYTFLAELPQEGTSQMAVNLPGREDALHVSSRSCMASVLLDGTTYPMYVDLMATGIWSRQRNYQLSVVKHYELVLAMHVVYHIGNKKPVGRVVRWGEVEGSIFSIPRNVKWVTITLFHGSYSMGIPMGEEEASSETNSKQVVTVFKTHRNSTEAPCYDLCRNTARCLKSQPGKQGCFLLYGPSIIDEKVFDAEPEKSVTDDLCEGCLGASLCVEGKGGSSCTRMTRWTANLLTSDRGWHSGDTQKGIQIRLHERFESREVVDYDQPKLVLRDGPPHPIKAFSYVSGNLESSAELAWIQRGGYRSKKGNWNVKVTLKKYFPSTYRAPLDFYLAVLLPDDASRIHADSKDPFTVVNASEIPTDIWAEHCQENPEALQFSICGGWRHTNVLKGILQPWLPKALAYHDVSQCSRQTQQLAVQIETEDGVAPAIWSIEQSCKLDMEAIEFIRAEQVLTLQIYDKLIRNCTDRVIIEFKGSFKLNLTILEVAREALNKFGDDDQHLVRLLESVDYHLRVNQVPDAARSDYYAKLGFGKYMNPPWRTDLGVGLDSSFKMFSLDKVLEIAEPPAPRGGFVETFCEFFDKEELEDLRGQQALVQTIKSAAARGMSKKEMNSSLFSAIIRCLQDKGVTHLHLNPTDVSPLMIAAKYRNSNAVKQALRVMSCCSLIDDGSDDLAGFLEVAVSYGCDQCLQSYLSTSHCHEQVDRTALVFTAATSVDTWADAGIVSRAFQRLDELRTLSFRGSGVPLHRILFKLVPVAKLGGLHRITYLSFLGGSHAAELDDSMARRLCALFDGISMVTVFFTGLYMSARNLDSLEEYFRCLTKLPRLREMDMDLGEGITLDWTASVARRLPRLRKVHLTGAAVSRKFGTDLEGMVPNLTVVTQDVAAQLRLFERGRCVPRAGHSVDIMSVW